MMNKLRRRYGLFWKSDTPSWVEGEPYLCQAVVIAFVFLVYGLIAANDARVDAEIDAAKTARMLVNLANGGTIVSEDGTFASKCENWVEVTK